MSEAITLVFWISVAIILYTYLGYALVLLVLASFWQVWRDLKFGMSRDNRRRSPVPELPFVSVVFPAHNEEAVIVAKIRNCFELDYPADQLEILVGCDGCEDRTAELAASLRVKNLRVFEFRTRAGKPATLNKIVPEARGSIVFFSDANTMLAPGSVRAIVRHFADARVGCVCGSLRLRSSGGSDTEGAYWRFESFLKFLESRLNMMVGANGGIFAIRRALYTSLPHGTVTDDFLISMRIREQGRAVRYDPESIGWEETAPLAQEFRRRVRIGAGNMHALRYTWKLLSPTAGLVALSYWSHKVLRWLVPFTLIAAFAASILLSRETFYAIFAAVSAWFILTAWIGYRLERVNVKLRFMSLPCYFLSLNLALLCGVFLQLFGRQNGVWTPTARTAGAREESEAVTSGRK